LRSMQPLAQQGQGRTGRQAAKSWLILGGQLTPGLPSGHLRQEAVNVVGKPEARVALERIAVLRWRAGHRNADSRLRSRRRLVLKLHWLPADKSVGSR
jgi:hypothetical protein